MEPRLREADDGRRTVLFVDAAHFVFGSFLGYLWCVVRRWVRGASGRQRLSVLGALNAVTNRLTTVSSDSYINAESVCELLRRLWRQYGDQPITVFLDNARYQRCLLVQELAEHLHIELQSCSQSIPLNDNLLPLNTLRRGENINLGRLTWPDSCPMLSVFLEQHR